MTVPVANLSELDRRRFMTRAASAFLGVGVAPYASTADAVQAPTHPATAHSVIYLNMAGGMSHIDTFDMKPARTDIQGPVRPIGSTLTGLVVSEHLPNMARLMDKACVVRSLNSNQGVHFSAYYYMHTSYQLQGTLRHPHFGAWVMQLLGKANPRLPGNIQVLGGSRQVDHGFMAPSSGPLKISDPEAGLPNSSPLPGVTDVRQQRRLELANLADRAFRQQFSHRQVRAVTDSYAEAVQLMASDDLEAFDISREGEWIAERYGMEKFGQGCLLARRLVERGVRFVEVTLNGWDTHLFNFQTTPKLSRVLDQGLASLIDDLDSRGMLGSTLVVLGTEFGRTPKIDGHTQGRGHWPQAYTCLLAGGGIRGGQVYGRSDEQGGEVADRLVSVPDFNATIAHALGLPRKEQFVSPSGQPFTVADQGQPVLALF